MLSHTEIIINSLSFALHSKKTKSVIFLYPPVKSYTADKKIKYENYPVDQRGKWGSLGSN